VRGSASLSFGTGDPLRRGGVCAPISPDALDVIAGVVSTSTTVLPPPLLLAVPTNDSPLLLANPPRSSLSIGRSTGVFLPPELRVHT
jgi:hypothetical protein